MRKTWGASHDSEKPVAITGMGLVRSAHEGFYFIDPTTAERLRVNEPPECLLRDPELRSGYDFLKDQAHAVSFDLQFINHNQNSPQNLGPKGYFEARVRDNDLLLLEGVGWTENSETLVNNLSHAREVSPDVLSEYVTPLRQRVLNAISGTKKIVGFHDIRSDRSERSASGQLVTLTVRQQVQLGAFLQQPPERRSATRYKQMANEIAAFQGLREWYMICQIGSQIRKAQAENSEINAKLSAGGLKVLIVVGKGHIDIARKIKTVSPAKVDFSFQGQPQVSGVALSQWLSKGMIPRNTPLQTLVDFVLQNKG